jgi:hypothetical protein
VVISPYGLVLVLDYFFPTDFRWWVIAVNAFSRFSLRGKESLNTAIVTLISVTNTLTAA